MFNKSGEDITIEFIGYKTYESANRLLILLKKLDIAIPQNRAVLRDYSNRTTVDLVNRAKTKRPVRTYMMFCIFWCVAATAFTIFAIKDRITDAWYWWKRMINGFGNR